MHERTKRRAGFLATIVPPLILASSPAAPHHGWSWYGDEDFSLTGRVVEKHFGNPHDRLLIETGGQEWTLVLSPPRRSRRAGFSGDEVAVGDTVTAYGRRHRDAELLEMKTERIKVRDDTYDLYPNRL